MVSRLQSRSVKTFVYRQLVGCEVSLLEKGGASSSESYSARPEPKVHGPNRLLFLRQSVPDDQRISRHRNCSQTDNQIIHLPLTFLCNTLPDRESIPTEIAERIDLNQDKRTKGIGKREPDPLVSILP